MKYTIYHVYEIKIGLTTNYPYRVHQQGLQDSPHGIEDQVSEGCGAEFAGKVEIFWQWYYGLEELNSTPYYLKGFVTGIAGRVSADGPNHNSKSPNNPWKTGEAGRASVASPNHNSRTGVLGRASAASPNHVSKQRKQCQECLKMILVPAFNRHMRTRHGK